MSADDGELDADDKPISKDDRGRALDDLYEAGLVTDRTDDEVKDLLVDAWNVSGGLPSRYAGVPERAPRIPDLTATDTGLKLLALIERQGQGGWRRRS